MTLDQVAKYTGLKVLIYKMRGEITLPFLRLCESFIKIFACSPPQPTKSYWFRISRGGAQESFTADSAWQPSWGQLNVVTVEVLLCSNSWKGCLGNWESIIASYFDDYVQVIDLLWFHGDKQFKRMRINKEKGAGTCLVNQGLYSQK